MQTITCCHMQELHIDPWSNPRSCSRFSGDIVPERILPKQKHCQPSSHVPFSAVGNHVQEDVDGEACEDPRNNRRNHHAASFRTTAVRPLRHVRRPRPKVMLPRKPKGGVETHSAAAVHVVRNQVTPRQDLQAVQLSVLHREGLGCAGPD